MSNIVYAQNKVLREHFGVDCYISKIEFSVANDVSYSGISTGLFSSNLEFLTQQPIPEKFLDGQGCKVIEYAGIGNAFNYKGILLYKSNLRKKLLKVMLKYN